MEEIKTIFIKHFGFFPDIISTTEHAYVSPPSRVISSLFNLSKYKNKKILRFVITDKFSIRPENCIQQICLPHILNKKLLNITNSSSKTELIQRFEKDLIDIKNIFNEQVIFSENEINNYHRIIDVYRDTLDKIQDVDSVVFYNYIIKKFIKILNLTDLYLWIEKTDFFGIDSINCRLFLKETLSVLCISDSDNIRLFGKYLEKNKRLKFKNNNTVENITWDKYLEILNDVSSICSIPFEIILYVYSFCGGSHFGNDYNMVSDINKLRNSNYILQLTDHNLDYSFNIEEKNIQFQKVSCIKRKWTLSHRIYKPVNTLPELYILLGKDNLSNRFIQKLNYFD